MDTDELVSALGRVAAGEVVVDRELVDSLLTRRRDPDPLDELTDANTKCSPSWPKVSPTAASPNGSGSAPTPSKPHIRHILRKLDLPSDDAKNRRVQAVLIHLSA